MSEITSGSKIERSPIKPATTREELIYLLSRASTLEHGLACAYLFVAYSLKNDASEGGLNSTQANMVRNWRRYLMSAATESMLHLAQLSNLLTAPGGTPQVRCPTFLASASNAMEVGLALEPFSQLTIERLTTYERLEANIIIPYQASGENIEHPQTPADKQGPEPFTIDYTTIRDLYDKIAMSFQSMPTAELFIGPPEAQAKVYPLNLDSKLIGVIDQASAQAAIAMIVGSGETVASSDTGTHTGVCETIRTEYAAAVADAQQAGLPFEPVRPVGKNPRTHLREEMADSTPIVDTLTVATADLFNGAYDIMLLMLQHFFTHLEESDADLEQLSRTSARLMATVIRPLGEALTQMPADSTSLPGKCAGPPFGDGDSGNIPELIQHAPAVALFEEWLWQLATAATTLCITPGLPTEIQEATAALQDLACQFAPAEGPRSTESKIATFKHIQAELDCVIQSSLNGPYLLTNVDTLTTWLGESMPTRPQMALCRCGNSATKPFCDGTHARIDFNGQKDPKRVPDQRDTYVGLQVTVLDNRGICAHSGFCTDRLSSAFHAGKEPFVSPSGARMDEIIRAVRSCPSGALSYAIDGREAREQVDQQREAAVEVSKDGPYRVTGGIVLKDGQGNNEVRNTGASNEHYSLCRCGHSQNKPFCSGMHWYVNFHDPVADPDHEPTVFEWAGGLPVLTRLTRLFYAKYVPQDPLIGPLFANMSPDHPERVAAWLGEVFGGPKSYSEVYGGYSRMISQHLQKCLTEAQRARWVSLMCQSADEIALAADAEFRAAFVSYIEWGSRIALENSQTDSQPPEHMPMPHWWWVCNATPGARVSALAPRSEVEQKPIVLPTPDELVSFETHIKPLFRAMDRQSMKFIFDLWSYQDVTKHADGILQRLQNGSMPCDGAWPHEKVESFQRWVESGKHE